MALFELLKLVSCELETESNGYTIDTRSFDATSTVEKVMTLVCPKPHFNAEALAGLCALIYGAVNGEA